MDSLIHYERPTSLAALDALGAARALGMRVDLRAAHAAAGDDACVRPSSSRAGPRPAYRAGGRGSAACGRP
ncbi:MAG: hypothetical protein U5K74_10080 [Gemmatimonadaceae bacterium]|nr:hypothetical protein [Gemmatimonadaceae bacterium]